ncbi:MAG: GatB/YqeY domain-containing protein [Crocinitomicaceae bacterium]|nr:GatB/YqeY domain-containing protein [Crocinitomicaceae bacterium]
MSLTERINNDIKEAMKSGQKDRLMALRDIKSKLLIEMTKGGSDGEVDDIRGIAILNKLYKQRMESIEIYRSQGREDLVNEELTQANVIKAYLPSQISEADLESAVAAVIVETGASGLAEMGRVMGAANKALAGKADGKAISEMVKKLLAK